MSKPPIIHLDCGKDITESYYNPDLPRHKCNKRISDEELKALGATMTRGYEGYNGCIPTEEWDLNGRRLIKTLSSCGDPEYTYLNDKATGKMLTLEDLNG